MPKNHPSKSPENFGEKEQILQNKLRLFFTDAKKIVILLIGNEMRRDDGIGIKVFGELKDLDLLPSSVLLLNAGTTPENFTGPIENWNPSHLLVIDAVDMGEAPGTLELIKLEEIPYSPSTTHKMSLKLLAKYLTSIFEQIKIKLLGIQIKDVSFGKGISPELTQISSKIATLLNSVLKEITQQSN